MSLAAAVLAHPPAQLSAEAEKIAVEEATAFRKALGKAIAAKDIKTLRDMYNDSFAHTHPSGKVVGKEEHIAAMRGERGFEVAASRATKLGDAK